MKTIRRRGVQLHNDGPQAAQASAAQLAPGGQTVRAKDCAGTSRREIVCYRRGRPVVVHGAAGSYTSAPSAYLKSTVPTTLPSVRRQHHARHFNRKDEAKVGAAAGAGVVVGDTDRLRGRIPIEGRRSQRPSRSQAQS